MKPNRILPDCSHLWIPLLAALVSFLMNVPPVAGQEKTAPLPLSKQIEQEKKENDSLVPAEMIDSILTRTRGFTVDRRSFFTAEEQSKILHQIADLVGVPYVQGGRTREGIDAGNFVAAVFRNALDWDLPSASVEQFASVGYKIGAEKAAFGDLVFFNTTGVPGSHVGIYLGEDLFAHASVSIGVTISSLRSSYYRKRFDELHRFVR